MEPSYKRTRTAEGITVGKQRIEQRIERRISRRRFVTSTTMALTGASLLTGPDALASQEAAATPATPLPGAGTPEATPAVAPILLPVAGPQLLVTPSTVRFDERFDILVLGVEPGQNVTITSTLGSAGPPWTATATYTAPQIPGFPDISYVDPAAMIPIDGTFDVADTMAFIWAATATSSPVYAMNRAGDRETVTITAAIGDVEIGTASIERSIAGDAASVANVDEDGLVGRFYPPVDNAVDPAPAVIVIGGSEGGLSPYGDLTAVMLASHGYAVLNLAYWSIGNLPQEFENIPLEYFGTAIRWLQRQPRVDPERIAIHGTSRGGEGALLVGSYHPEVKAVVSNVGAGYVIAAPWSETPVPAWTWQDESLPYAGMPGLAEEDLVQVEIPVERINGPVLLIGADADGVWPSSALSKVAFDRLQRHGHPWADQLLRYPGAGHIITVPYQPVAPLFFSYRGLETGGDPHSNAIANANSWPAILAMFASRLKF